MSAVVCCDLVSTLFGDFDLTGHPYINTLPTLLMSYNIIILNEYILDQERSGMGNLNVCP